MTYLGWLTLAIVVAVVARLIYVIAQKTDRDGPDNWP